MVHWSKGCSRDLRVITVINLVWDPVFLIYSGGRGTMVHLSKGCSRDLNVITVVSLVCVPVFLICSGG